MSTELYIYRDGAVVIQTKELNCPEGESESRTRNVEVVIEDVSDKIKESSFTIFGSLEKPIKYEIHRKTTDYYSLIESFIDKKVSVLTLRGDNANAVIHNGRLIAAKENYVALLTEDNKLQLIKEYAVGFSSQESTEELPDYHKNTSIKAVVSTPCRETDRPGLRGFESLESRPRKTASFVTNILLLNFSYETTGLTWNILYDVHLSSSGDLMNIIGKVAVKNETGVAFTDATIHVVNASLSLAEPEPVSVPKGVMSEEREMILQRSAPDFNREYDTYLLPQKLTIDESYNEQFLTFFEKTKIPSQRKYVLHTNTTSVRIVIRWTNSKSDGVGILLPPGIYSVSKFTKAVTPELLGEVRMSEIPVGQHVDMNVGTASSIRSRKTVVKESKDVKREDERGKSFDITVYKLVISNHKQEDVELEILEHMNQLNWTVYDAEYYVEGDEDNVKQLLFLKVEKKPNSDEEELYVAKTEIQVPAESKVVVTYTVEYEHTD